jgi:hypothetical protein
MLLTLRNSQLAMDLIFSCLRGEDTISRLEFGLNRVRIWLEFRFWFAAAGWKGSMPGSTKGMREGRGVDRCRPIYDLRFW